MTKISSNFSLEEVRCRCGCGKADVSPKLVMLAEHIRHVLGDKKMKPTSVCRCERHNKNEGGSPTSQHVKGKAMDFKHETLSPKEVFRRLYEETRKGNLKSLGCAILYPTFVHVDVRDREGDDPKWMVQKDGRVCRVKNMDEIC